MSKNKGSQKDKLYEIFSKAEQKKYGLKDGESRSPGPGLAVVRYQTVQSNDPKTGNTRSQVPIYGKVQPSSPTQADAQKKTNNSSSKAPAAQPAPQVAPGLPSLMIPSSETTNLSEPGVDVRLIGEKVGIKAKKSKARLAGKINTGTSRLTIPRSSGAASLNIG